MFTFLKYYLNKKTLNKILFSILLSGVVGTTTAHTYFFGVTDININQKNKHIEIIHQLTAHDIENAIAEIHQINFSPEYPQYDEFIQEYIEEHFILERNRKKIELIWIGFEVKRGQLFAYQESASKNYLTNLVVKNSILVDTYDKQVNTVNYQNLIATDIVQGSLTFDHSLKVGIITSSK
jgi:hypothetical protein